jgi:hypothetical protein
MSPVRCESLDEASAEDVRQVDRRHWGIPYAMQAGAWLDQKGKIDLQGAALVTKLSVVDV